MQQWFLYDERDGKEVTCEHCNKTINRAVNKKAISKYYILQSEFGNEETNKIIGSGCVKKFTGQTIQEIKKATDKAIKGR